MDKGIYVALSGGLAKVRELELVSNNLANANTPGFKRDQATFNEYLTELRKPDSVEGVKREINAASLEDGRPNGDKGFVEMDAVYTSFEQAPLMKTGRTLDIGLDGEGFFEVLTPSGIRHTRAGNFSISPEGKLVTINGFPVLASAKELPQNSRWRELSTTGRVLASSPDVESPSVKELPPEERTITLGQGRVEILPDGTLNQGGRRVAKLSIDEFFERQWLEKVGNTYYRNTDAKNLKPQLENTKALQGFLEGSNVNPIREMTKLIEVTRAYESAMQAIKTYQDIDSKSVSNIAGR